MVFPTEAPAVPSDVFNGRPISSDYPTQRLLLSFEADCALVTAKSSERTFSTVLIHSAARETLAPDVKSNGTSASTSSGRLNHRDHSGKDQVRREPIEATKACIVKCARRHLCDGYPRIDPNKLTFQQKLSVKLEQIIPILPDRDFVVISANDTVAHLLRVLQVSGLRTAVVEKKKRGWVPGRCFGSGGAHSFIDIRDVSYHIVRVYQEWASRTAVEVMQKIEREKVSSLSNCSGRVPFVPHSESDTLATVMASFDRSCRIPVYQCNKLVRVLTPADFFFILNEYGVLRELEKSGINLIQVGKREVRRLLESESLLKGVTLMERHGYSALPIVSEDNFDRVLEVLTLKDLRYLFNAQGDLSLDTVLNAPAVRFVEFVRNPARKAATEWAFLSEEATLTEMCHIFLNSKIHRAILLNKEGLLTGLLALSDVVHYLVETIVAKQKSGGAVLRGISSSLSRASRSQFRSPRIKGAARVEIEK